MNNARCHVWRYKYCNPVIVFRSRSIEPITITADGSLAEGPYILADLVGVVGTLAFGEVHSFAVVASEEGSHPASAPASAPAPELPAPAPVPAPASAADTYTPFAVQMQSALGGWHVLPGRTSPVESARGGRRGGERA